MPSYIVIGATRGIGLEITRQLAQNPENKVFGTARNIERSVHLTKLVQEAPAKNVHVLQADIVDAQSLKDAAAKVAEATGGTLDVLIHSAAKTDLNGGKLFNTFGDYKNMEELDADFIDAFKVNTLGAIHSVEAFLPLLRAGATKKVIFISSGGAVREVVWKGRYYEAAAYSVTKSAENMVMTKYAAQLEAEGFTVASICPGTVDVTGTLPQPMSEAEKATLQRVHDRVRKLIPDYSPVSLTPEQSVTKILGIALSLGPKDSASFHHVSG